MWNPVVVKVWDVVVRAGHWILVAAFVVAYTTEDEVLWLHSWAGYVIGVVLVARILWGFVGTKYARFSDFVRGPRAVFTYLADLVQFRARRFIGHSPAGGAMAVALMLSLAITTVTGMMVLAVQKGEGPLGPWLGVQAAVAPPARADSDKQRRGRDEGQARESKRERDKPGEVLEGIHELFANLTLILAILHVVGVAVASLVHRENLVRAMITGWKRAEPEHGSSEQSRSASSEVR